MYDVFILEGDVFDSNSSCVKIQDITRSEVIALITMVSNHIEGDIVVRKKD